MARTELPTRLVLVFDSGDYGGGSRKDIQSALRTIGGALFAKMVIKMKGASISQDSAE